MGPQLVELGVVDDLKAFHANIKKRLGQSDYYLAEAGRLLRREGNEFVKVLKDDVIDTAKWGI